MLDITEQLRQSLDVGTVLTDLSKAFDCILVPHSLLLCKLHAYDMNVKAVNFLSCYKHNGKQRVKIASSFSEWRTISKGVPQGSVVGPLMFNLFLNDIYGFITEGSLFNYADDNTLSVSGDSLEHVMTVLARQSANSIAWFDNNLMEANPSKFQAMFLHRSKMLDVCLNVNDTEIKSEHRVKLFRSTY